MSRLLRVSEPVAFIFHPNKAFYSAVHMKDGEKKGVNYMGSVLIFDLFYYPEYWSTQQVELASTEICTQRTVMRVW